jgi:hypothetical protein
LTVPSGRTLMLAGLRSRWNDAGIVRGLRAHRRSAAHRQRLVERQLDRGDELRQILALDELHDQRADLAGFFEAVQLCDVRMVEAASVRASRQSGRCDRDRGRPLREESSAQRRARGVCHARDTPRPSRPPRAAQRPRNYRCEYRRQGSRCAAIIQRRWSFYNPRTTHSCKRIARHVAYCGEVPRQLSTTVMGCVVDSSAVVLIKNR